MQPLRRGALEIPHLLRGALPEERENPRDARQNDEQDDETERRYEVEDKKGEA